LKTNRKIINATRFDNSLENGILLKITRPEPVFNIEKIDHISATNFNILVRNPYDFYAKYILNLKDTNILKDMKKNALLGSFLHSVFENLLGCDNNAEELVNKMLDEFFYNNNAMRKLYEEKTILIVKNFCLLDDMSRKNVTKILTEEEYRYRPYANCPTLTARVDRVEYIQNNLVNIIDYKTGTPQAKADMINGRELQMPFTAFILKKNNIGINKIGIWEIKSNKFKEISLNPDETRELLDKVDGFIQKVMNHFSKNDSKFLATIPGKYSDYKHLSRANEWLYND
jgi:ATP-dependent helicase/nuclease subunit B